MPPLLAADLRGDQRALERGGLADLAGEILGHRGLVEHRVVAQVRELVLQLAADRRSAHARAHPGSAAAASAARPSSPAPASSLRSSAAVAAAAPFLLEHQLDDAIRNGRRLRRARSGTGSNGIRMAKMAKTMKALRTTLRKRCSTSSVGDQGKSYRR